VGEFHTRTRYGGTKNANSGACIRLLEKEGRRLTPPSRRRRSLGGRRGGGKLWHGYLLPALTTSGVVSPTAVVLFVFKKTVQSDSDPPDTTSCCILGYHSAAGAPVQTYATIDRDTSGNFSDVSDASIASHEIGEWMDDPLAYNATPPWGNVGQVSGCQGNWEVGDPLLGILMPPITTNGKEYQMQELAFFSWYFNTDGAPSVGAGGKF
jgi:hypothetical protein